LQSPFLFRNIPAQNNVNVLVEKPEGTRKLFIHGRDWKATLKIIKNYLAGGF
jgi:hypothetical protein